MAIDVGPFRDVTAIEGGGWEFVHAPTVGSLATGAWNALRPARSDGSFYVLDFNGNTGGTIWLFDGNAIVPGSNFDCPTLEDYNNPGTFKRSTFVHITACVVNDGGVNDGDIWARANPFGTGANYVIHWDDSASSWNTIRSDAGLTNPGDFVNILPSAWDNITQRAYGLFTEVGASPNGWANWGYVTSGGTIVKIIDNPQRPTAPQGTYTMYTGFYNAATDQHWQLWSTTSGGSPSDHSSAIYTPSGSTWALVSGSGQLTFQFWEACITDETNPRLFGRSFANFPPNREIKQFASSAWSTIDQSNILAVEPAGQYTVIGSPVWLDGAVYWYVFNSLTAKWEFWKFTP